MLLMVKERDIVVSIILSIVTCGLYAIYWFIVLTDDAATLNGDTKFSGGMAFLLTLITCGIYGIYWYYKMGKELYEAGEKRNVPISDNSVLYIILGLFGFGIINYCIMQSDINKMAKTTAQV
jgi:hypothetical protein